MNKRFGFKEIRTSMGLFDFDVICIVGDYKNAGKYIRWKFEDKEFSPEKWDLGYEPRGKCFFSQGYVPVIWIPKKPRTPREIATLAHECIHAVFHLFAWASLSMTRDTEEVLCHSTAHLVNNILKNL